MRTSPGGSVKKTDSRKKRHTEMCPSTTSAAAVLFTLLAGLSLLAFLYPRCRSRYLTDLRGPEPSSFWLGTVYHFYALVDIRPIRRFSGNEADIRYQNEVGDCEFKWMREYGSAWCRAGCFGVSTSFSVTAPRFVTEQNNR